MSAPSTSTGGGARVPGSGPVAGGSAASASAEVPADVPGPGPSKKGGRRRRRRGPRRASSKDEAAPSGTSAKKEKRVCPPPRSPSKSVVSLTGEGKKETYASVLSKAMREIDLPSLGIANSRLRRGVTGSILVSIPGKDSASKADALSGELRRLFSSDGDVRVGRPSRMEELRVRGILAFMRREEILASVAVSGGCGVADLKAGEIRMCPKSRVGSLWIRCPVGAARRLGILGSIDMRWTRLTITALARRPIQCYRCHAFGHSFNRCGSEVVRSNAASGVERRDIRRLGVRRRSAVCLARPMVGVRTTVQAQTPVLGNWCPLVGRM
ncbi:uncharacterized protein LOC114945924 [Nylanderia fulva]|uniref:uncharacterized protein LOC114945924 n=1 Tax=Nylanderia fulva TaxID=613905 RepID=UPI0010FB46DA|nr:uncharacterized protein LOC114945924 [Nylanderia fulva]